MNKKLIRNFSIIAHVNHGKSTLADRILELTGTVKKWEIKEQLLDSMELERERGITIKLNFVQLKYKAQDKQEYIFHLIDTPGHIDFTYEVSRSLTACEGVILVIDATQGIEAQTLTNFYLAINNNLSVIFAINKIDLPTANPNNVKKEIKNLIGIEKTNILLISAKTGLNIKQVLETIIKDIPPPLDGNDNNPLQALIFDSYYDKYRGVIISIRIKQGIIKVGDKIRLMNTKAIYKVTELGIKKPKEVKKNKLISGEVGWLAAGIKIISDVHIGDTITTFYNEAKQPLPGYKKINPMVFCGLYIIDSVKYKNLKEALKKIKLSDSSFTYEQETSQALGFGFRCGFLGLLHMDIIKERLEREYNLELIITSPSVIYRVYLINKKIINIDNPNKLPSKQKIIKIEEPFVKVIIITPEKYIGSLIELCQNKRGIYINLEYIDNTRSILTYEMPLNEIIFYFFDQLKSISKGYASLDYDFIGYRSNKLVKIDILLNNKIIDALSIIIHNDFAHKHAKILCKKLKEIIPRQNFEVPIQAIINKKIIARENIKAIRKNVLSKCSGGDVFRKKKLLEKQKKGKKRMKIIGSIKIPNEAFINILKLK